MMKHKITLFFLLSFWCGSLIAQQVPGKRDSINSVILKEKRYLQIVLPPNYYVEPNTKFDVIYVLDGDGNTKLLSDVEEILGREGRIPRNIIVGVYNTDRDRDFLPTHNESNHTSGGADHFLDFFKNELIPYINKTYRSNGENTLFGHSFGGVFVTYALLTEPQLFDSYIAADPSFWWDNAEMLTWVPPRLSALTTPGKTLYIAGQLGPALHGMGISQMDTILQKFAPAALNWKVTGYPDENHGTVRLKSAYDGLKFSYPDYRNDGIGFWPMNGILLKGKPITLHLDYEATRYRYNKDGSWYLGEDTARVRYTIDGSLPQKTSRLFPRDYLLTKPGKITIRRVSLRSADDETFSGNFMEGDNLLPGKRDRSMNAGGFNYSYYEGTWTKLPDFKTLKPVKTGRTDSTFDINKMPRQDNFAIVVSGQFEVREDGYYLFYLNSDDGSRLYVGNKLLIDYDGLHGDQQGRTYIIPLKKGFYPLREEYFQGSGGRSLTVEYLTPATLSSKKMIPIPLALQYGR